MGISESVTRRCQAWGQHMCSCWWSSTICMQHRLRANSRSTCGPVPQLDPKTKSHLCMVSQQLQQDCLQKNGEHLARTDSLALASWLVLQRSSKLFRLVTVRGPHCSGHMWTTLGALRQNAKAYALNPICRSWAAAFVPRQVEKHRTSVLTSTMCSTCSISILGT